MHVRGYPESTLLSGQPASVRSSKSLDKILPAVDPVVLQILLGHICAGYGGNVALKVRVAEVAS